MLSKILAIALLLPASVTLRGQTRVLVGAIPTGASFAGVTPLRLPFADAEKAEVKSIENGLNQAVAGILPAAEQQGFSFICLLSAPGDSPVEIPIPLAKAKLKLSRKNTSVVVLFYRGGHEPVVAELYSTGAAETKVPHVSTNFKKIMVPEGGSTAGWVYMDLTRVQAEAEKAKSPVIFISAEGGGRAVPVPIPGLKDPLMVPDETSILNVSWYLPADARPNDQMEILGHSAKEGKSTP